MKTVLLVPLKENVPPTLVWTVMKPTKITLNVLLVLTNVNTVSPLVSEDVPNVGSDLSLKTVNVLQEKNIMLPNTPVIQSLIQLLTEK